MATKKKKKTTFDIGPMPAAPLPRSLSDELGGISEMLGSLGSQSSEQYLKAQKEMTQFQWDFFKEHAEELGSIEREQQSKATERVRNDAYNWMAAWGPHVNVAQRWNNPVYSQAQDETMRMLGKVGAESPFTAELDRMAMDELKLGGALSPEQERNVQQSSRAAYAARGQALSNPSAITEVMTRDAASQARLRERQGIAGGREAVGLQNAQAGRQFVLESGRLSQAESMVPQFLGMQGTSAAPAELMGFTQGVRTPDPNALYGAGLNYASDLYNTNLNMQASMYNDWQNNNAALQAATLQSKAQIAAAQAQASAFGGGGGGGSAIGGSLLGAGGAVIGGVIAAF